MIDFRYFVIISLLIVIHHFYKHGNDNISYYVKFYTI